MTKRSGSIATLTLRNSSKSQGIVRLLKKAQLLHRLSVLLFTVSLITSIFATKALATNSTGAQIYGWDTYYENNLFSASTVYDSDPHNATLLYTHNADGRYFSAEATATAYGHSLGVEGRAFVGSNLSDHFTTRATAGFLDTVTFSRDGILNLEYVLTGLAWRNTSCAYSANAVYIQALAISGGSLRGSDLDLYRPSGTVVSDPSLATLTAVGGTLRIDSSPGSPLMLTAGTPYVINLALVLDMTFNPVFEYVPECLCYSTIPYGNVSGGMEYLRTLTLTDLYLTDTSGARVPFSYSSSEGVTYPTSVSVPEPGTLALLGLGLGLAGLAALRRRRQ